MRGLCGPLPAGNWNRSNEACFVAVISTLMPDDKPTEKKPGDALTEELTKLTGLSFFGYLQPLISSPGQLAYGNRAKFPKEGSPPVPESWRVEKPVTLDPSRAKPPWFDSESVSATGFAIPYGTVAPAKTSPENPFSARIQ